VSSTNNEGQDSVLPHNSVERGAGALTRMVKIEALVRDTRYQIRFKLDQGQVATLAAVYKNENPVPPVKVAQVGEALVLVDGYHRVQAQERVGRLEVEAVIVQATERDACWLAVQANLTHGVRLKPKEVRKAFRVYIKTRQHYDGKGKLKSYRTIAQDLGGVRGFTTIRVWMWADFRKIALKMGGDEGWKGEGGLQEVTTRTFAAISKDGLAQARAAFQGITDPEQRGEVIHYMVEMLTEMKRGEWQPYAPDF